LPLTSSDRTIAALRRLGFLDGPTKGSSHISMFRPRADGGKDVTSVVTGKKEIPRGTLKGILEVARVTQIEFLAALNKDRK
jgi:predicted RNA binding protein YcfA (HicA-like mRNA interferase family)